MTLEQACTLKPTDAARGSLATQYLAIAFVFVGFILANQPARAEDVTTMFDAHVPDATATVDHSAWNGLLSTYVVTDKNGLNLVNYKAWKSNGHKALKSYVAAVVKTDPAKLSRNEQFAFWANLYNAKTIDIVLDHYPVSSIKNISLETGLFSALKTTVGAGGPWKTPVVTVSGKKLSLDDIEHKILRPIFKDPRVHYAVNCASIGCPNLANAAFTGKKLNDQLDANARAYINSPRGIRVDNGSVTASSIYNWFQSDFGGSEAGVLLHAKKYASVELKQKLQASSEISSYDYDWNLNDTTK